jgi:hypothetical protein
VTSFQWLPPSDVLSTEVPAVSFQPCALSSIRSAVNEGTIDSFAFGVFIVCVVFVLRLRLPAFPIVLLAKATIGVENRVVAATPMRIARVINVALFRLKIAVKKVVKSRRACIIRSLPPLLLFISILF